MYQGVKAASRQLFGVGYGISRALDAVHAITAEVNDE
jgi:hypothetical protein